MHPLTLTLQSILLFLVAGRTPIFHEYLSVSVFKCESLLKSFLSPAIKVF